MRKIYLFCCLLLPSVAVAGPIPEPVVAMGVEVQAGNISCTGMHDGTFQLTLVSNGGFVIYEWESLFSDTLGGIGSLTGSSPSDLLDSLPPGDYLFKVMNLNGNDTTFAASIIEPPPLGGTRPRQVAMALSKELTNHSLPEIGDAFGGRDHTTVLHACRVIKELRTSQTRMNEDYQNLLRTLAG